MLRKKSPSPVIHLPFTWKNITKVAVIFFNYYITANEYAIANDYKIPFGDFTKSEYSGDRQTL